jgi:segregation and condensation protein B
MSNTHEIAPTGIQLRVDFDRTPASGEGDSPAFAGAAPSGADDELVPDAAAEGANAAEEALTGRIIEALLFSSDAPLSATRLAELVETATPAAVRKHVAALNEKYEQAGLSFRIEGIARGYQMMTLPDLSSWVAKLNKQRSETRLSAAALEALSIVAYKQPIIRANVEAIRGVACGEVLSRLREMGLIRILGRAEVVGRPLLYGTTRKFLDVFGLVDIEDLPPMEALRLKSATKPAEEVEPVKPPPIPEPQLAQCALTGA